MSEPTHYERAIRKFIEGKRKLQITLDDDPNALKIDTTVLKLQHNINIRALAELTVSLWQAGVLKEVAPSE